jgi:hypothetical protein
MSENWFNRVCELHDQGRHEEARLIYEAHTTPDERDDIEGLNRQVSAALAHYRPGIMKMRAALQDPDNPKSMQWLALFGLHATAPVASVIYKDFPNPLETRGRRRGSGEISNDVDRMLDIHRETNKPAREIAVALMIDRHGKDWPYLDRRVQEMVTEFNKRG